MFDIWDRCWHCFENFVLNARSLASKIATEICEIHCVKVDVVDNKDEQETSTGDKHSLDQRLDRKLKQQTTLKAVCHFLGDEKKSRQAQIIYTVGLPVAKSHWTEKKSFHKVDLTTKTYIAYAQNKYDYVLKKLAVLTVSADALQSCGFDLSPLAAAVARRTEEKQQAALAAQLHLQEETEFASLYLNLTLATMKHRALSMASYTLSFPGRLAGLLNVASRADTLKYCRSFWEALLVAEEQALLHTCVAHLLDKILVADWVVIREVLMHLAQTGFTMVPKPVALILDNVFKGTAHSAIVEDGLNKVRDVGRDTKNRDMSHHKAWHQCVVAKVCEQYGRDEVQVDSMEDTPAPMLQKQSFSSVSEEPSLEDPSLQKIMSKPTWTTTHAQGMQSVPTAISYLLHVHAQGTWSNADPWCNILFNTGGIITDPDGKLWVVLGSTAFAVLAWPCKQHASKDMGRSRQLIVEKIGSHPLN